MKFVGSESPPGVGHFACGGYIAFRREHFACGRYIAFRWEHFRMRQLRGGEAFVVAKAILPSSRSTPPGHAAVLRCGMCCFAGGAMDFTVLDIVGYADIDECTTL